MWSDLVVVMLTRGSNKGEDASKRQNSDFIRLSERMEGMAAKFEAELSDFKKKLSNRATPTGESGAENDEMVNLHSKFFSFEKDVLDSLQDIRREIDQLRSNMSRHIASTNQNCILIHGVAENQQDLYKEVIDLVETKIGTKICKSNLNTCYRMGTRQVKSDKPRPVLVSFCQRWLRDEIFYGKKRLKGSAVLFTELLTSDMLALFKEARKHFQNSCWTMGGKVFIFSAGRKTLVNSLDKLNEIIKNAKSSEGESQ